jgi:micrococcal nuclease
MAHKLRITKHSPWYVIVLVIVISLGQYYGWFSDPVAPAKPQVKSAVVQVDTGFYRVTKFVDGDTIHVEMNGKQEKIRLIGVDTPETHDPRAAMQCYGEAAAAFTKQLIGDHSVRLQADPQGTDRDRYDRLLRYVYLPDNTLVNAEIIKQGYGFGYLSFPFSMRDEFRQYEKQAREGNKGLWSSCHPTANKNGTYTSNPN